MFTDVISLREILLVLEICQKYLAPSHPSAAVMIEYAVREIDGKELTTSKFRHKATNSSIHIRNSI